MPQAFQARKFFIPKTDPKQEVYKPVPYYFGTLSTQDAADQIAEEFNSLSDRLQTTEEARRRFVSDASHELKTPLAGIRLLSDSILQTEDIDAATVREFVGDIVQETA